MLRPLDRGEPAHRQARRERRPRWSGRSKRAQATDFVRQPPERPQTDRSASAAATSRAASASGSSIARALLKDPPIMVLDEATSALDAATEGRLQAALDAATRGRTTFVIAHRLATIRNADVILVFERGRIVESGRSTSWSRASGAFAGSGAGAVHDRAGVRASACKADTTRCGRAHHCAREQATNARPMDAKTYSPSPTPKPSGARC